MPMRVESLSHLDLCSFRDVEDEFHVGVVVVIAAARYRYVLVSHSDVFWKGS